MINSWDGGGALWSREDTLALYRQPATVPDHIGEANLGNLFPHVADRYPLVRIEVLEGSSPTRQRVDMRKEADGVAWQPVLTFLAFCGPMPHTEMFTIQRAEVPRRERIHGRKNPQARDISSWTDVCEFWAYPNPMPGSSPLFVDWTSSPDRYAVVQTERPQLAWLRCSMFNAFVCYKYHLLESAEPPKRYRLLIGQTLSLAECDGWRCLFAFYGFDAGEGRVPPPGANRYWVQKQDKVRVGAPGACCRRCRRPRRRGRSRRSPPAPLTLHPLPSRTSGCG